MNDPRQTNKSNPTARVAVFIVVVVLLVIGTFLYNAIKGKREYEQQNAAQTSSAAQDASSAAPASAAGASQ